MENPQSTHNMPSTKKLFLTALLAPIALGVLIGGGILLKNSSFSFGTGVAEAQHIRGNKNAPVKLVEYSDFQCPFCGRHYPTLKKILADYGDKVSLEYKHFPLGFHPNAKPAAEASECAAEQNKFWEFHDKIFENQDQLSPTQLTAWAKEIGLNMTKFNQCVETHKYAAKVDAEEKEGQAKGVNGTPATFINGKLVSGAQPYEALKQVIDAALIK